MTTQDQIIARFKECVQIGFDFYGLRISDDMKSQKRGVLFDLTGKVAGQYIYNNPEYKEIIHAFRVNLEMAEANLEHYLNDTVPHEVAHYFDRLINPRHTDHHGLSWGEIMIRVFNISPTVYHKYEIPHYFSYSCRCGKVIQVSPTIHNKMQKGQKRYTNCHNYLLTEKDLIGRND